MTQRIQQNPTPDAKSLDLLTGVKKRMGMVSNLFSTVAHSSAAVC